MPDPPVHRRRQPRAAEKAKEIGRHHHRKLEGGKAFQRAANTQQRALHAIADHQHFGEFDAAAGFTRQALDFQNVILGNAILLAARLDDCVHVVSSFLSRALWRHRGPCDPVRFGHRHSLTASAGDCCRSS